MSTTAVPGTSTFPNAALHRLLMLARWSRFLQLPLATHHAKCQQQRLNNNKTTLVFVIVAKTPARTYKEDSVDTEQHKS